MVYLELHLGEAVLGLLQDLEMGLGLLPGIAYLDHLLGSKTCLKPHPGDEVNVILPLNQKHCLTLPEHEVILHHPQNSTIRVSHLREKEVGQSHQSTRKLWLEPLLGKEVDLGLPKSLMESPAHPLRKEVTQTPLQILNPRLEPPLDRGVILDHLQRLTASLDLLPGSVGLAHLLK